MKKLLGTLVLMFTGKLMLGRIQKCQLSGQKKHWPSPSPIWSASYRFLTTVKHFSTVAELKGVCWFGLKNATDIWQVIDAGLAQMLKVLVGQKHRMWLDESENVDRWYENQTPYTAMEQRNLITHWVGDAWEILCGPNYEHLCKRCWENHH